MEIAGLIPAYKPTEKMVDFLRDLSASEMPKIILVNDGSPQEFQPIFDQAFQIPKVIGLSHPENLGKGAALKTGLRYMLENMPEMKGVVTADADGQHSVEDTLKVGRELAQHPEAVILGGRKFDKDVPWKSMAGNTITRNVLRWFFGLQVYDTQTGLRGLSRRFASICLNIAANRYDFELEMLLVAQGCQIPIREITIQTIYFDENRGSHFKPWRDSARVYKVIFRNLMRPRRCEDK